VLIPICGLGVWPISYLRSTAGWFDRKLGLALGVTNAGIGVGSMLIPLLTAYLIANYGWREAYLGLGLIAFVAWPVAYLFLTDPQPQIGGVSLTGDTLREASRTRPFWLATLGFFLLGLFTTGLIVHQVRIFIDAGIPPATATAIPAAFGFALIIGRLGTGWLLDRISAAKIMAFLMACGVVATLIFTGKPDVTMAIFAAVLVGLITGAEFDVLSYIIPRYNGRRSFGQIYGAIFAVFQLGGAIGIYVIGAVRGSTGSYAPAMYGLMAVCVAAGLLFTLLGPYRFRPGEHA
jgi:predicted MFS family arabinose efflux permease